MWLLFFMLISNLNAQVYNQNDKEGLRVFLRQPSKEINKLNLEQVGLAISDTANWYASEKWLEKVSGVEFDLDSLRKIPRISDIIWGDKKISGKLNCTYFDMLESLYIADNDIESLVINNCPKLQTLSCEKNERLKRLDLVDCLYLQYVNCTDDTGLQEFRIQNCPALQRIYCENTLLKKLDVSNQYRLESLYCSYNENLKELIVDGCYNLTLLSCANSYLTNLDLKTTTKLESLNCSGNDLEVLDLSRNILLRTLYCDNNKLSHLEISNQNALRELNCDNNQLVALDVSKCIYLYSLHCGHNKLTDLNLFVNTSLNDIYCAYNQLSTLNLSNAVSLEYLNCSYNTLSSLKLPTSNQYKHVICSNNLLKLSTLPHLTYLTPNNGQSPYFFTEYYYSPQGVVNMEVRCDEIIDLGQEYSIDSKLTKYKWYNANNVEIFIEDKGKGRFMSSKAYVGQTLLCRMTNSMFPQLEQLYKVKILNQISDTITLMSHFKIVENLRYIPLDYPFHISMQTTRDDENIRIGLYTTMGQFIVDILDKKENSTYSCIVPPRLSRGSFVIQPYIIDQGGHKLAISRPANSFFVDKLPIRISQDNNVDSKSLIINTRNESLVTSHMQMMNTDNPYYEVSVETDFVVYVATERNYTQIGLFDEITGKFVCDITKRVYGDTYTCLIPNHIQSKNYIIMPYRVENDSIKIIERSPGAYYADRLPLKVLKQSASSRMLYRNDDTSSVMAYPNPVVDMLYIKGIYEDFDIKVYDLSGHLLKKELEMSYAEGIDFSSFVQGIYVLELNSKSGKKYVFKIQK